MQLNYKMQQITNNTLQRYKIRKLSLGFWGGGETAYRICIHLFKTKPNLYQQLKENLLQDAIKNATHNNYMSSQKL